MVSSLYILGDADRIREKVEASLFANDLAGLSTFSTNLTEAISRIVQRMNERLSATVIMAGGDDVFFIVAADRFNLSVLGEIASDFTKETGCTISFGVGASPDSAYLFLRHAKAAGGGAIRVGPHQ